MATKVDKVVKKYLKSVGGNQCVECGQCDDKDRITKIMGHDTCHECIDESYRTWDQELNKASEDLETLYMILDGVHEEKHRPN